MRDRSQIQTVPVTGTWKEYSYPSGGYTGLTGSLSGTVVDHESLMWDDAQGGRKADKACTHLTYIVSDLGLTRTVYHPSHTGNVPNPMLHYEGYPTGAPARLNPYRPSAVLTNAGLYVPVTGATTDDLGNCVFNAYNQFVNSVTALDASQSLAEIGETPNLFNVWQRRRALPTNLVNGFLNYSFGWKPVWRDLVAIQRELRSFPETVRKRLKSIGDGDVVRHYKFNLSATVDSLNHVTSDSWPLPSYGWSRELENEKSVNKSRVVVVTIRAKVKPKLTGDGQLLLDKLGALGAIPSLSTVWAVTRLSFVIDWFYNIGGAIENLQGSLTHNVSNVRVCISDTRTREIEVRCADTSGYNSRVVGKIMQRYYCRQPTTVPILPSLRVPTRPMQYVLLGALALVNTKTGGSLLRLADNSRLAKEFKRLEQAAFPGVSYGKWVPKT